MSPSSVTAAPLTNAEIHWSWAMRGSSQAISVDIMAPTSSVPSVIE